MKAAIYTRVSTQEQASEGFSLEAQLHLCRILAKDRGYTIVAEFTDAGVSGTSTKRPQFQALLTGIHARAYDVVICHKLDRLSRSLSDTLIILKDFHEHGAAFVSVTEQFDFTTPIGRVVLSLLGALSEWYVANLRAEISKGKVARSRSGISNASIAPFGYQLVNGEMVQSDNAPHALWIFESYAAEQHGYASIGSHLNALGLRTVRGNSFNVENIREIIINPFYAGWVQERGLLDSHTPSGARRRVPRHKAKLHKGNHAPIVSQELFDRCQAVRHKRHTSKANRKPKRVDRYLLAGLAHCSHCGRLMRSGSRANGKYSNYQCTSRRYNKPCDAQFPQVTEQSLETQLAEMIGRFVLPDAIRERALELATADQGKADYEARKDALGKENARLIRAYTRGDVPEALYDAEHARITAELATLERPVDVPAAIAHLQSMAVLYYAATQTERAAILHVILERVDIDPDTARIIKYTPHPDYAGLVK